MLGAIHTLKYFENIYMKFIFIFILYFIILSFFMMIKIIKILVTWYHKRTTNKFVHWNSALKKENKIWIKMSAEKCCNLSWELFTLKRGRRPLRRCTHRVHRSHLEFSTFFNFAQNSVGNIASFLDVDKVEQRNSIK